MLKASKTLSNLEMHQMQQILQQYNSKIISLEEDLNVIETERDYDMAPYYLYYLEGRVSGFILIDFVVDELLQAKIYVEEKSLIDILLRQFKSYLIDSKIETVMFCMEEELDHNEVQSLILDTCEYQMVCSYDDFLTWTNTRKVGESKLRWLTLEDEEFYKYTLEKTFLMGFEESEERFLSLIEEIESIWKDNLIKENGMAGVVLESQNGEKIGIGGCYVGNRCISLFDLAVIEKYRGQGYGSELLYFIFEKTKDLKKNYLLQVSSNNIQAVALYQSIGFKIQEQLNFYQLVL